MDSSMYDTFSNVDISTYNNRFMQRNTPVPSPLNLQSNTCMSQIRTLQQQHQLNLQQQQQQQLQLQQRLNLQQQQQYPMFMQQRMMMELNTLSMPQQPVHNKMTVTKKKKKPVKKEGQNQKEKRTKRMRNQK